MTFQAWTLTQVGGYRRNAWVVITEIRNSIKDLTNPAGYALKTAFHTASGIGNVISEFQESRASLAEAERQLNELDCSIPEVNAVKKEIEAYDKTLQEIENKYIASLRVDQLSK